MDKIIKSKIIPCLKEKVMRYSILFIMIAVLALNMVVSMHVTAKLLFHDDFEKDAIDQEPKNWEIGFKGDTKATVVADPKDAGNNVLKTSDKPSNDSRHDVGGSIYVVGEDDWSDYVAEWDMMFPDDFYMGIVFRFVGGEEFYLSDRRQGGNAYIFYKHQGGWAQIQAGAVPNKPDVWYSAQLTLDGDEFTFKLKDRDDDTPFDKIDPVKVGKDDTFKTGKFGNYGLIYLDNLFIGDSVDDLVLPVEPQNKLSTTWGIIKSSY